MALAAGVVVQDLLLGVHQGAGLVGPAEPLEQRSFALDHHQVSSQEQVAADIQIQPVFIIGGMITDLSESKLFI